MATTAVTLNGTTYFVPQPGEKGPTYDQDLTNYLIALATAFPQGGAAPSSTFQALTSAGSNAATAGRIRLSFADQIDWRNSANTGNLPLGVTNGSQTNGDNLDFVDAGGNVVLITGQPYVEAAGSTTSFINGATTVATWTTSVTDTDSAFNVGTGTFTVPAGKGGQYAVCASIRFSTLTANAGAQLTIWQVNGATAEQRMAGNAFNGTDQSYSHATVLNVTAGQTIKFAFTNNNGANKTPVVSSVDNRITIKRLV